METIKVLEQLGLEGKQAAVYAALLELGTASVMSIAQKAGLKRPTTYLIIDELESKGLVSQVPQAGKTLFVAESPEKLQSELRKKQELLIAAMPQLEAIYNARKDKPKVQLYQGIEGMKQVYEQIYASGEVWFFATLGDLEAKIPGVTKNVSALAASGKLKVRELLSGSPADIAYASRAKTGEHYQIRFTPQQQTFFTDNAIFGKKVAFFSFKPQLFAVVIESNDIVQSLRSLFSLAWENGSLK